MYLLGKRNSASKINHFEMQVICSTSFNKSFCQWCYTRYKNTSVNACSLQKIYTINPVLEPRYGECEDTGQTPRPNPLLSLGTEEGLKPGEIIQLAVMPQQTTVGVVLFLSGRGAGGISGGPVKKNMALTGESKEKTLGLKGRSPKKFLQILQ